MTIDEAEKQPPRVIVVTYWPADSLSKPDPALLCRTFPAQQYGDALQCARTFAEGVVAGGGMLRSIVNGVLVAS